MPIAQTAWSMGLLGLPLAVLFVFMRKRRRTMDFAESRAFKSNLPWWVKNIETLMMLLFGYLWTIAVLKLFAQLTGGNSKIMSSSVGATAVYTVVGLGAIVLPLAMLSANVTSWIVPFLRKANNDAFLGTQASFRSMNAGLIRFASISVPFGIMVILIAAFEPWSR